MATVSISGVLADEKRRVAVRRAICASSLLRDLLMDDPSWTDDVIERVLEAIRTNAPDEVDEVVHRILKQMR